MSWFLVYFFKVYSKISYLSFVYSSVSLNTCTFLNTTTTKIQTVPSPSPIPSSCALLPTHPPSHPWPLAAADLVSVPNFVFLRMSYKQKPKFHDIFEMTSHWGLSTWVARVRSLFLLTVEHPKSVCVCPRVWLALTQRRTAGWFPDLGK